MSLGDVEESFYAPKQATSNPRLERLRVSYLLTLSELYNCSNVFCLQCFVMLHVHVISAYKLFFRVLWIPFKQFKEIISQKHKFCCSDKLIVVLYLKCLAEGFQPVTGSLSLLMFPLTAGY